MWRRGLRAQTELLTVSIKCTRDRRLAVTADKCVVDKARLRCKRTNSKPILWVNCYKILFVQPALKRQPLTGLFFRWSDLRRRAIRRDPATPKRDSENESRSSAQGDS